MQGAHAVATGDFNHDGVPDLALADARSNNVAILLGASSGSLQPPVNYAVGSNASFVAVGDFNGDGKLDLAVTNVGSNNVSILLGNGDGTFQPQITYAVGHGPQSAAVGDFNGDGKLDLAVANRDGPAGQSAPSLSCWATVTALSARPWTIHWNNSLTP